MISFVDRFIEHYKKTFDFYREAGRISAQICETNLEQMGIRAIVTYRAKRIERLKEKLEKRNIVKNYESFEEIIEDIVDLTGVRVALYFPGDLYKVQQFIESNFRIAECKTFPEIIKAGKQKADYQKRFSGYWATHYRVHLKNDDLPEEIKKYSDIMIEIQVASVLMHAWAEVEHDLIYKPFSGELSYEEYQILDELNGLVLSGEIALQRLQKAVKDRVSQAGTEFNNHYEVASFLNNNLGPASEGRKEEIALGRVDLLFKCIISSDFNKPEKLKEILVHVDPERTNKTIVDQIMDRINGINPVLYENYRELKQTEELKSQMDTLQMNRENGNRQGEANTLANIGYLYSSKDNYDEAIHYFMEAVKINQEIGGKQGEANQLLNLGSAYRLKGDMEKALEYCNRAIRLHEQISYKQGQANTLGVIGNIYSDSHNYNEAADYYNQALEIFKETGYKAGEITQLNNLGMIFFKQEQFKRALDYFNYALDICAAYDYKQGEGEALHNIGNIYFESGSLKEAFEYYEKALLIQDKTGNQKHKIGVLKSIAKAYEKQGEAEKALDSYNEILIISNNIEYKKAEEDALENIRRIQGLSNHETE
jgi:tetratricopeptide (TPR) repeat protein